MSQQVILCVDDEEIVLTSLESQLRGAFSNAYSYEFAENADDAFSILQELEENGDAVVIVISDWLMPGLKGDEFLVRVHSKYPQVSTIMLTGQADQVAIENACQNAKLQRCMAKPWDGRDLVETIRGCVKVL